MSKLGIIGGLGPMATFYFCKLIVELTDVKSDQDHLEMIVYNHPSTPDRTAYILDNSLPSPVPVISTLAKKLEKDGADLIAIPCITSHCFFDEIQKSTGVTILNLPKTLSKHLFENNVKSAAIMATSGTLKSGIFQKYLEEHNITSVLPNDETQEKIMQIIYSYVKAGINPPKSIFDEIEVYFKNLGAEKIILGCTELSVASDFLSLSDFYTDTLAVAAKEILNFYGLPIKNKDRK